MNGENELEHQFLSCFGERSAHSFRLGRVLHGALSKPNLVKASPMVATSCRWGPRAAPETRSGKDLLGITDGGAGSRN